MRERVGVGEGGAQSSSRIIATYMYIYMYIYVNNYPERALRSLLTVSKRYRYIEKESKEKRGPSQYPPAFTHLTSK